MPKLLESVGGTCALLGLVAMANDSEGLYASLKALLCALRNNVNIETAMNEKRAYQVSQVTFTFLFVRKVTHNNQA